MLQKSNEHVRIKNTDERVSTQEIGGYKAHGYAQAYHTRTSTTQNHQNKHQTEHLPSFLATHGEVRSKHPSEI
jgi:hypothetical protein